jgi:dipeptidyl aminopeptidase/acylaminoacyl peptidase
MIDVSRRNLLTMAIGGAACALSGGEAGAATTLPPLIDADYAVARQRFRTKLTRIGPAPDPPQPLDPPAGARRMAYRSGDLELAAWISVPDRAGRSPAILFMHGGNVLGAGHWDLVGPYRAAGYVAMMPTLRGENGQAGIYSGFYDETADVLAAAEALRAHPNVDRDRMFIAGHSIGGTQTLLATLSSSLFRGAAAFSGAPDAYSFFARFPEMICFDTSDPREFQMRSALSYATSFKCPVRIWHGEEEHRQDGPARLTATRARTSRLDVEAATVPGGHMTALPEEIARSLAFFRDL